MPFWVQMLLSLAAFALFQIIIVLQHIKTGTANARAARTKIRLGSGKYSLVPVQARSDPKPNVEIAKTSAESEPRRRPAIADHAIVDRETAR